MVRRREKRIPIMMSDDELEAIDAWRFENRIATRAEALRRLCQIGLLIDDNAEQITTAATRLYEGYTDKALEIASGVTESGGDTEARASEYVSANFHHQMKTIEEMAAMLHSLNLVMAPFTAIKESTDSDDARYAFIAAKAKSMADFLGERIRAFEFKRDNGLLASDFPKEDENRKVT